MVLCNRFRAFGIVVSWLVEGWRRSQAGVEARRMRGKVDFVTVGFVDDLDEMGNVLIRYFRGCDKFFVMYIMLFQAMSSAWSREA